MRERSDGARFGIVLYDTVEALDLGATYGVLSMARRVLPNLEMVVVAEHSGPVELANGLCVMAGYGFSDCPPLDVAIVCGGAGWGREGENPAMRAFLERMAVETEILAAVCSGGMILGAVGHLDGLRATTQRHRVGAEQRSPLERLAEMRRAVTCVPAPFVDAGRVVTGGGVALAIDTTLHLIGRLYGAALQAEVTEVIEYSEAFAANRHAIGRSDGADLSSQ